MRKEILFGLIMVPFFLQAQIKDAKKIDTFLVKQQQQQQQKELSVQLNSTTKFQEKNLQKGTTQPSKTKKRHSVNVSLNSETLKTKK